MLRLISEWIMLKTQIMLFSNIWLCRVRIAVWQEQELRETRKVSKPSIVCSSYLQLVFEGLCQPGMYRWIISSI